MVAMIQQQPKSSLFTEKEGRNRNTSLAFEGHSSKVPLEVEDETFHFAKPGKIWTRIK